MLVDLLFVFADWVSVGLSQGNGGGFGACG